MQLKDLLKEYLLELQLQNYSKRTIKGYKNNNLGLLTFVEKEFNIIELEKITHQHVKMYVKNKQDAGLSESYINSIIKSMTAFFNYLVKEEYIEKNIIRKISFLREPATLIKTPTDKEIERMLKVYNYSTFLEARNKCIISTLIDTGVRNLELCEIKVDDIKENFIYINKGKGNKQRVVPLSGGLRKVILKYNLMREKYIKSFYEQEYLFLSRTGKQLTIGTVENIVEQAGIEADVDKSIRCSPHTLRHYYAQSQLKNGLDLYSLSRILGHSNIKITKRYLQSMQDEDIIVKGMVTSPLNKLK